jgi:UDP-N-acetylglucosamine 2-epimerase (non-hydrolysing)
MTRSAPRSVRVLVVVGTRPEAIKLAPVIRALRRDGWADVTILDTGQHAELTTQALSAVGLTAGVRLTVTRVDHSLAELATALLHGIDAVLADATPDAVIVQGDTTSALVGAQASFYRGIPVGHVEAGLRTGDPYRPFPEEANRRMIAALARWHFAPTARAREHLLAEGVPAAAILVSGNTIVDELRRTAGSARPSPSGERELIITLHRRESIGGPLASILRAIKRIAANHPELTLWFPLHANPQVRETVHTALGGLPRMRLVAAMDYPSFVARLQRANLVMTDSGGVTEEAAVFGVPTLIVRDRTERPEAVEAGIAEVVGTGEQNIVAAADRALARRSAAAGSDAFGDGHAGERIAAALRERLSEVKQGG